MPILFKNNEESILNWLRKERRGKLTTIGLIKKSFLFIPNIQNIVYNLENKNILKKLKNGYKLTEDCREFRTPRKYS